MYTPRTSVEAIPNASIHHSALQNRDFGHTYDRSRALVRAIDFHDNAWKLQGEWHGCQIPGARLVPVGRRLREACDERAHGALGEFGRRAPVALRPPLLVERGPRGQSRPRSYTHMTVQ